MIVLSIEVLYYIPEDLIARSDFLVAREQSKSPQLNTNCP